MRIVLLCGGDSSERDISFKSASGVYASAAKRHDVTALDTGRAELFEDFSLQSAKPPRNGDVSSVLQLLSLLRESKPDLCIIMLHGGHGEDGHMQALLDMCAIPYTGAGMGPSFLGMDKIYSKYIMDAMGIPTPAWAQITSRDDIYSITDGLDYPLIIKPAREGSTLGLTKIDRAEELDAAVKTAFETDDKVLAEAFIPGREMTVPVMDGVAYPVVEIIPKTGLYDYESKYGSGMSEYICPADIPAETARRVSEDALSLYGAMGLRGVVRFDFRLDGEYYYFLEANTLPGMTSLSLVPMSFKAAGTDYDGLIERIISGR